MTACGNPARPRFQRMRQGEGHCEKKQSSLAEDRQDWGIQGQERSGCYTAETGTPQRFDFLKRMRRRGRMAANQMSTLC
jgi:hypothetical protein